MSEQTFAFPPLDTVGSWTSHPARQQAGHSAARSDGGRGPLLLPQSTSLLAALRAPRPAGFSLDQPVICPRTTKNTNPQLRALRMVAMLDDAIQLLD